MALKRNAARFLAADQYILGHHIVGDVVEAHRRFVELQAVALAQPVDHAGGGNRPHHRAAPAAFLHQVPQGQRHDFMRVDEVAVLVHGPDAVGIPIGGHAKIAHACADRAGQRAQVLGDRFGVDVAEARVHLAADLGDLAAGPL